MPVILRLFGSIFFFPAFQQTQVIAQHPKTFLLCLPVSHFLADFSFDDCLSWRTMTFAVKTDREILCQLQGSFLTAQSKEAGSEINHISVPLTGKAMEPPVHLHAGMSVIVKRTTGHPVPSYWNPIKFRSLSCRDRLLYCFKYIRFPHLQTNKRHPVSSENQMPYNSISCFLSGRSAPHVPIAPGSSGQRPICLSPASL